MSDLWVRILVVVIAFGLLAWYFFKRKKIDDTEDEVEYWQVPSADAVIKDAETASYATEDARQEIDEDRANLDPVGSILVTKTDSPTPLADAVIKDKVTSKKKKAKKIASDAKNAKFSREEIHEIRTSNESNRVIAERLKVSPSTISAIRNYVTYRYI